MFVYVDLHDHSVKGCTIQWFNFVKPDFYVLEYYEVVKTSCKLRTTNPSFVPYIRRSLLIKTVKLYKCELYSFSIIT